MPDLQQYSDTAMALLIQYVPQLLLAIITLVIGLWIIKLVVRGIEKAMTAADTDVSLRKFLLSLTRILLKAVLIISVAGMVGIETTSFVAILGAAGLAVGLALQGSLANFAGGVLILIFKPFTVGDVIEAQGFTGKVHGIQVFNTIMKTPDNKTIIIPNGALSSGSITNYSTEETRRIDLDIGISYDDDIAKTKTVLDRLVSEESRVLKNPGHEIMVSELGDNAVIIKVRAWTKGSDFWGVYFDLIEKVKLTFDQEKISFPFPQRDVHLYQQNS